ncbi:MAG TPA: DUF4007 family protein [Roseiflexaceae bacterium]|nr:DUF4007 family protein [Roseiflexaceae bacterium]
MSVPQPTTAPFQPVFSGHETFALRGAWLKKAYDLLLRTPNLFAHEDAFVRLGVGKNMAQSIRYWGRVCGVFARAGSSFVPTPFGRALLDDDGWDPFLVTPAARWLLHWQIAARPEAAFTFYFAFNLLRGAEFTAASLAGALQAYIAEHGWPSPSAATLGRDVTCLLHCYVRPSAQDLASAGEDTLACPLADLDLVQLLAALGAFRLRTGDQPDLPDALVVFAVRQFLRQQGRVTAAFHDLVFAPGSPGRVFRLDEDALLGRLERFEMLTGGAAAYSDSAGVRQVHWAAALDVDDDLALLADAFAQEVGDA